MYLSNLGRVISASLTATYSIESNVTSVNEGSSVTFTVTTEGVLNGTVLYWSTQSISGTVNASDFTDSAVSGSVTVNNNTATIIRTLRNDFTTEGTESFALQIRTGSTSGDIVAISSIITTNDTSVETYSISPNVTSVNEGSSVTFTVTTEGVPNGTTLFWTTQQISGAINASDFTDSTVSGSFTINNNTASIVRTLTNDFTTEGTESFALQIRTNSTSGVIVATSATVTINDTSVETYAVAPNVTSVNEGSSVTFTVTTQGVLDNTTLFWTTLPVSGTVNASDFTDETVSGLFTINNGTGSIVREIRADATTEGTESFALQIRTNSTSGVIVATSATVTINDTSVETYAVAPNVTSVNEGSSVTFTVTTQGVANGTTLFWSTQQVSGTVNASDFTDALLSGSFTINSGTGTVVRNISNDKLTEGTESFALQIRTESTSGTLRATSSTVTISDTSITPTYSVSPNVTSVNEGSSVTFTVTTQGVANGTTLYWTTQQISGTVNASDFTDDVTSGSFTINNNSGSVVRTLRNDFTIEGTEQFRLQIRTESISGTLRATSSTVTINDTSVPTYAVAPNVTSVNEGSSVTFTVTTQGVANGTTLFWSTQQVSGTVNASDFTDALLSGSFTINSGTGTVVRNISNDKLTEGTESFALQIRTESTSGTLRATSSTVTISDTSITSYTIIPNVTSVNEGSSVTFTVTTDVAPNGTTLYWTTEAVSGTITNGDFVDGVSVGSLSINNNTGSIVRTIRVDGLTEGTESFRLQLRTGSTSGTIVATSATVTINDVLATIVASTTSVNEGGSVTFTVTTTNIPSGTTLTWTTNVWSGAINANDFTDGLLSGTFTVNNNTGSIVRGIRADLVTEGSEQFRITVSYLEQSIGTSDIVTINDTSLTPPGQILFTSSTFGFNTQTSSTWTVPAGVTSISMICIGAGGGGRSFSSGSNLGGGGGGGGMAYVNNFGVTPGASVTVRVGNGGSGFQTTATNSNRAGDGGASEIVIGGTIRCRATGGSGGSSPSTFGGSVGSGVTGSVLSSGGPGGRTDGGLANNLGGGGGAAGFQGFAGGQGAHSRTSSDIRNATAGTGGGGGGGGRKSWIIANSRGGHGGGTGVLGQTTNGAAGANDLTSGTAAPAGNGGSGSGGSGKLYGGGGGGGYNMSSIAELNGGSGAVRIMWPGNLRSYPSTRTANE